MATSYVPTRGVESPLKIRSTTGLEAGCYDGQMLYDQTADKYYYYKNGAWVPLGSTSGGASLDGYPYGQYDYMNPSGCASNGSNVCEEWTDDVAAQTWEWGNQGTATETITQSGALLTGNTTDQMRARWTDPPLSGNTDFTISAIIRIYAFGTATGDGAGVAILSGGTVASPTEMASHYWVNAGTDGWQLQTWTDYATPSFIASIAGTENDTAWVRHVVQLRYVDSTRVVTAAVAHQQDKLFRIQSSTTTLSGDPIKVGYFVRRNCQMFVEAFRVRIDDLTLAGA